MAKSSSSAKPNSGSVHTTPNPNGTGWVNQLDGQVVSRHRTQTTAAERGREIARGEQAEHVIHRPDGRIRDSNSYGNDPNPPRDQR